jgi:hypothetical protein
MTQGVLSGVLAHITEEDRARVKQKVAERVAERRGLAARRGAATRKARREAAEAQGNLRLVYLAWNKPRNKRRSNRE